MHGAILGHESSEVSWDAQADIEEALLDNEVFAIAPMDYYEYIDSMEPAFAAELMAAVGIDPKTRLHGDGLTSKYEAMFQNRTVSRRSLSPDPMDLAGKFVFAYGCPRNGFDPI